MLLVVPKTLCDQTSTLEIEMDYIAPQQRIRINKINTLFENFM